MNASSAFDLSTWLELRPDSISPLFDRLYIVGEERIAPFYVDEDIGAPGLPHQHLKMELPPAALPDGSRDRFYEVHAFVEVSGAESRKLRDVAGFVKRRSACVVICPVRFPRQALTSA